MNKYKIDLRLASAVASCFITAKTEEEALDLAVIHFNKSGLALPKFIKNWVKIIKL